MFANDVYLRPDFYKKNDDKNGIIFEVERGRTLANNMYMYDFWKCHICDKANYLFLMVPITLERANFIEYPFDTVKSKLETFFIVNNYTNVDAVFIFGY